MVSAKEAGYMELANAVKSAGCKKVAVPGGVSQRLGCCNLFEPKSKSVYRFNCGNCEYVRTLTFGGRIGEKR